jgi:hypothetical protein
MKVSSAHRNQIEKHAHKEELFVVQQEREKVRKEEIRQGTYHDGRLDCVAGNGVISELGFGDEKLAKERDSLSSGTDIPSARWHDGFESDANANNQKRRREADLEMVESLPIVVVKNFELKTGDKREELLEVLAQWSVSLVENQVCPAFAQ